LWLDFRYAQQATVQYQAKFLAYAQFLTYYFLSVILLL